MTSLSPSYLAQALREDGLDSSLESVGNISDLIDALVHLESLSGTANFQRDLSVNRRAVLAKGIDVVRDTKKMAADTGQTIDSVYRTIGNVRLGFAVVIVVIVVSFWMGVGTGSAIAGVGTALVLGLLSWYYWSVLKLTLGNASQPYSSSTIRRRW